MEAKRLRVLHKTNPTEGSIFERFTIYENFLHI